MKKMMMIIAVILMGCSNPAAPEQTVEEPTPPPQTSNPALECAQSGGEWKLVTITRFDVTTGRNVSTSQWMCVIRR